MSSSRRGFFHLVAGAAATRVLASSPLLAAATCAVERRAPVLSDAGRGALRAIAFDAFPIFDPRPIVALAEELFPGRGTALSDAWRTRQFEYTWLRVASGRYADFWRVTEDALIFAARSLEVDLRPEQRGRLMDAYLDLRAWPDVLPALRSLVDAGIRLSLLSNLTPRMLGAAVEASGLKGVFEHVLSTDPQRTYKPDPRAYQVGLDAFGLEREEILFVPSAGWDAAGARWFGYPTFWVNRTGLPGEELGVTADATGSDLADLVAFVAASR